MAKKIMGLVEGRQPLTIMMPSVLADALSVRAKEDRRTLNATIDLMVDNYLSKRTLVPLPEGSRLQRHMAGAGEAKIRRYLLEPKTVRLLTEAETLGYSQSFIIEESVKEGLTTETSTALPEKETADAR